MIKGLEVISESEYESMGMDETISESLWDVLPKFFVIKQSQSHFNVINATYNFVYTANDFSKYEDAMEIRVTCLHEMVNIVYDFQSIGMIGRTEVNKKSHGILQEFTQKMSNQMRQEKEDELMGLTTIHLPYTQALVKLDEGVEESIIMNKEDWFKKLEYNGFSSDSEERESNSRGKRKCVETEINVEGNGKRMRVEINHEEILKARNKFGENKEIIGEGSTPFIIQLVEED